MRRIFIGTLVVLTIALINGCANRKITRVDPNETIDLSGRWNDSDSRLVSEEMIGDLLTSAWIPRYLKANDKRPVVVVGLVENKSHEHINSETFIKDVEKAIIRDGNIRLVVAGEKRNELRKERAEQQDYASPETTKKWGKELGSDFILQGTINSIVDSYKKQKVSELTRSTFNSRTSRPTRLSGWVTRRSRNKSATGYCNIETFKRMKISLPSPTLLNKRKKCSCITSPLPKEGGLEKVNPFIFNFQFSIFNCSSRFSFLRMRHLVPANGRFQSSRQHGKFRESE